jgi:hypothetical protein
VSGRARLAIGAAASLLLIAAGVGLTLARDDDARSGEARSGSLVDDKGGAYRGVRMGDSPERVRRILGEPSNGPGFAPADTSPAEIGVPQSIPGPGTGLPPDLLKYENVAFVVGPSGVYAFIVTEDGAATTRGVAIGDGIDTARTAYRVRCIDVAGGESLLGGGQEFYPSCGATLKSRLRVWFGRDPIRSITLVSFAHARAARLRKIPPPRTDGRASAGHVRRSTLGEGR